MKQTKKKLEKERENVQSYNNPIRAKNQMEFVLVRSLPVRDRQGDGVYDDGFWSMLRDSRNVHKKTCSTTATFRVGGESPGV